jgi:transcription antitermination factor NusG
MDWGVCTTVPSCERRADADLVSVGFSTYYPRYESAEAIHGRIVKRARPLFPGYLFFGLDDFWYIVHGASEWVIGVLMWSEETPAALPQIVVDELRERAGPDDVIRYESRRKRKFNVGATIRATNGPFASLTGVVEHLNPRDRLQVLFDLFGRKTTVEMSEADITAG